MASREVGHAQAKRGQVAAYIRETASGAGMDADTDKLSRLAELKATGDLPEAETSVPRRRSCAETTRRGGYERARPTGAATSGSAGVRHTEGCMGVRPAGRT